MWPIGVSDVDSARLIFHTGFTSRHTQGVGTVKKTWMGHLEFCVSLLQVRFLAYILICHPMPIRGVFREDLIKADILSSSQENFKRRDDQVIFLNDLKSESIASHSTWFMEQTKILSSLLVPWDQRLFPVSSGPSVSLDSADPFYHGSLVYVKYYSLKQEHGLAILEGL